MVKMLIGQYQSKLAENGRASLPKKFRDELGNKYIITRGYEQSLLIVAFDNWENMIKDTSDKSFLKSQVRDIKRFLIGGASLIELDDQGRFIVPQFLRDYAQISGDVVFLGLGDHIELWDLTKWETYQKRISGNIEEIAQKLTEN